MAWVEFFQQYISQWATVVKEAAKVTGDMFYTFRISHMSHFTSVV